MKLKRLWLVPCLLLAGAGGSASESVGEDATKPCRNVIKWATASEVDNFGFDVYRATTEEGPFTRLNEDPVPGAGNSDEVSRYEYVDDTIEPETEYWYYVESISMSGEREKFTPTQKVAGKRCSRETAGPEQPDGS
jgi:hypothetical protein